MEKAKTLAQPRGTPRRRGRDHCFNQAKAGRYVTVHAAKGPIPPAPQITTTPAKAMPGAKGSTTVYSRPKSVAGGFAGGGAGVAPAPGRRVSERRGGGALL